MTRTLLIAAVSLMTLASQQSMASTTEGQFMAANNDTSLDTTASALVAQTPNHSLSGTRYASQGVPDRFAFTLEKGGSVSLASRHLAGAHDSSYRLSALLLDNSGQVVASSASDISGNFHIDRELSAGQYTLVVNGNSTQSPSDSDNGYEVLTSM